MNYLNSKFIDEILPIYILHYTLPTLKECYIIYYE